MCYEIEFENNRFGSYYEVSDPDAANLVAALFGDEREDYNCTTLPSSEAARQG